MNHSLWLFARAENSIIKEQIIGLLMMVEANRKTSRPKIREEVEDEYNKRLEAIKSDTPLNYEATIPEITETRKILFCRVISEERREAMPLRAKSRWPLTRKRLTVKQMSISEAHEKGHVLRDYNHDNTGSKILDEYFKPAFDFSAIDYTNDDFKMDTKIFRNLGYKIPTFDQAKEHHINYLSGAEEIVERMSQLKNYFGFSGDEIFTKEHFDYARENYVKDTGFDNRMTNFFEAITSKTEEKFLELINKSGI